MDTQVWSFLIIVVVGSVAGYFLVKHYATYHVNKKTKEMLERFRREQGIAAEDRPLAEVERELMAQDESRKAQADTKQSSADGAAAGTAATDTEKDVEK